MVLRSQDPTLDGDWDAYPRVAVMRVRTVLNDQAHFGAEDALKGSGATRFIKAKSTLVSNHLTAYFDDLLKCAP